MNTPTSDGKALLACAQRVALTLDAPPSSHAFLLVGAIPFRDSTVLICSTLGNHISTEFLAEGIGVLSHWTSTLHGEGRDSDFLRACRQYTAQLVLDGVVPGDKELLREAVLAGPCVYLAGVESAGPFASAGVFACRWNYPGGVPLHVPGVLLNGMEMLVNKNISSEEDKARLNAQATEAIRLVSKATLLS